MFGVGFFLGVISTVCVSFVWQFYRKSQKKDKLLAESQGMRFEEEITLRKKAE